MTWHPRKQSGPTLDDVANARTLFADVAVMTWRMTVQNCWRGCCVAGQPGSVADNRVKTTRGERGASGRAWAVLSSARVGACGHAGCRFFAGFSPVNASLLPLRDGNVKNTF
jgi:hypothetical protein